MTLSVAIDVLAAIATDAACWRITNDLGDDPTVVRSGTGAELYAALDVLLALPPADAAPAARLVLDPHQPR